MANSIHTTEEQLSRAEVIIKAFRAVDEPELCQLFISGHERVLTSIGVEKVTSSDDSWTLNPASFVVLCMSTDRTRAYGGARVHVCGGTQPLPFISGVDYLDATIHYKVEEKKELGTGELCGLWNSLEVAGMGIGAIYVVRAAVAIINQLHIRSCFALCSPQGARISMRFGFKIRRDIGDEGTFYYPKQDLIATMVCLDDCLDLSSSPEDEKQKILELRENPNLHVVEENRGKLVDISYELNISNIDPSVFDFGQEEFKYSGV